MSRGKPLTLPMQAAQLRACGFATPTLSPTRMVSTGRIRPGDSCALWNVEVVYRQSGSPTVYVLSDAVNLLEPAPPHVFPRDETGRYPLCLYDHGWDRHESIANTIVPWTAEWLFFFEVWVATEQRLGGGAAVVPPSGDPKSSSTRERALLALRGR